jgi:hypothetical protein
MLFELWFDKGKRERGSVNWSIDVGQHVRHGADVILVTMRQHQGPDLPPFLLEPGQVRGDQVDAELVGIGKHHARVDHNRGLAPRDREHVHPELAEPAEWNDFEHPGSKKTDLRR